MNASVIISTNNPNNSAIRDKDIFFISKLHILLNAQNATDATNANDHVLIEVDKSQYHKIQSRYFIWKIKTANDKHTLSQRMKNLKIEDQTF